VNQVLDETTLKQQIYKQIQKIYENSNQKGTSPQEINQRCMDLTVKL
jgi:hypothetical protein